MGLWSSLMDKVGDVAEAVGRAFGGGQTADDKTSSTSGSDLLSYIAGGSLGALGSVGTSLLNNYFSRKAGSREYKYTKSLMDYANEYNEPLAQRMRLEEAGFNPNLFYSTGANTSASGNVSVQAAKASPIDLLAAYNIEAQNELLGAQRRLIDTQINNWKHDHRNPYKDIADSLIKYLTARDRRPGETEPVLIYDKNTGKYVKGFVDPRRGGIDYGA